jgi:hypothetical protein
MNTETITNTTINFSNHFTEQFGIEAFFIAIEAFRAKARKEGLNSTEHIFYNALRNLPLDRGFTPITRPSKINNGHASMGAYENALSNAKYMLKRNPKHLEDNFKLTEEKQKIFNF